MWVAKERKHVQVFAQNKTQMTFSINVFFPVNIASQVPKMELVSEVGPKEVFHEVTVCGHTMAGM